MTPSLQEVPTSARLTDQLAADFLLGAWVGVGQQGDCRCQQVGIASQGGRLVFNSLCLSKQGQEIQRQGSLTFTNALRTQFTIETPSGIYSKSVVAADLEKGEWILVGQLDGQQQTLLVRPWLASADSLKGEASLASHWKNLGKSVEECISSPKRKHHRILSEKVRLSVNASKTSFNTDLKGIFVSSPNDGQKCIKPVIRRATLDDIVSKGDDLKPNIEEVKETWNLNSGGLSDAPKTSFLIAPSCSQKLEQIVSVSQIKGTKTLIFSDNLHESMYVEELSTLTTQPLGPILCKGRFKGIGGGMIATIEETIEVSRNVTDINNSTEIKHKEFKGLIPPSCSYRLEPIVSVTQKQGTNTLIFEAPEHETVITQEINVVANQLLGPVICNGRFRGIGGGVEITVEETVEVSRNVTDINNSTEIKHREFKGLIPPACSYRLEPIVSVTQRQGTQILIFEAPEHEIVTTQEINVVSSQRLSPVLCKGRFRTLPTSPVSYTESTMGFPEIWRALEPALCESSLPQVAEFSYSSATNEVAISIPEHITLRLLEANNVTVINGHLQIEFDDLTAWNFQQIAAENPTILEENPSAEIKAEVQNENGTEDEKTITREENIAAAVETEFGSF